MTKSDIFRKAWIDARTAALQFGGKAREYFAAALRQVYAFLADPVGKLVALGGKEWRKPEIGKHRVYFDSVDAFVGVTKTYKGFEQDGRPLSSYSHQQYVALRRFHYDVLTRTFAYEGGAGTEPTFKRAVAEIKRLAGI